MVDLERLSHSFELEYRERPRLFSAPGRVNLIGEHTDYNDGFVLPMAIDRRTFVAGTPRADSRVVVHSQNTGTSLEFDLGEPAQRRRGNWLDYVEGTARSMMDRGFAIAGANLLIASDVPAGAGLSASAALELSVGFALASLAGATSLDRVQLALAGQTAEHEYVGTMCGIMDQYIAALGQEGQALLIDCRSLGFKPIALELGSACILICDTRVKHELASSAYNERRSECEQGVLLIARVHPEVKALRDVSQADFDAILPRLPRIIGRRCRHVVTEIARTLSAADYLQGGQLAQFGALMSASHASLRDDYEVSCPELDEAVAAALGEAGVYGSRMTGGGFGGCTVSLVEREALPSVQAAITRRLSTRFGITPEFFATRACPGVREE